MPQWLKTLLDELAKQLVVVVKLLWIRYRLRVVVLAAMLVIALVLASSYIARTKQYQGIVSSTVNSVGEDTPQRYKVLEAFTLSSLDTNLTGQIADAELSDQFTAGLSAMDSILSRPTGPEYQSSPLGARVPIPSYVHPNRMRFAQQDAIVSDIAPTGFLFFPLKLLRTKLDAGAFAAIVQESGLPSGSPTLARAILSDPTIADDFRISHSLLGAMDLFQAPVIKRKDRPGAYGVEIHPAQIYYITKNGVNRIINHNSPAAQQLVYKNMFRSTTFFPSRPYYVAAFKKSEGATLKGVSGVTRNAFYVSQPYLDIGGFGAVITLARSLRYEGHSDAAIAFDLPVIGLMDSLRRKLRAFGADPEDAICTISFGGTPDCGVGQYRGASRYMRATLQDKLSDAMGAGDLSTVVGNISTLDSVWKEPQKVTTTKASPMDLFTYPFELITGINTRPITFAVPLEAPEAIENPVGLKAKFLIVSLNLERYQQKTALIGLASLILIAAVIVGTLFSWYGELERRKSFEDAFQTVEKVLGGAPTPYIRLDARDRVAHCNTAFCGMLKMAADKDSVESLKTRTFESLVSPRSKGRYQGVQASRLANKEVASYTLAFICEDATEVEALVNSEVIPTGNPGRLPETFGIVVPAPGKEAVAGKG